MGRFVWRLQRVLDARSKSEQAKHAELMVLTEGAIQLRQRILLTRMKLRNMLEDLREKDASERAIQQQFFLRHSSHYEKEIAGLKDMVNKIELQRKVKMAEIHEVRKSIKALEKLKERSKEEFVIEQNRLELNELDDLTSIKYANRMSQIA